MRGVDSATGIDDGVVSMMVELHGGSAPHGGSVCRWMPWFCCGPVLDSFLDFGLAALDFSLRNSSVAFG